MSFPEDLDIRSYIKLERCREHFWCSDITSVSYVVSFRYNEGWVCCLNEHSTEMLGHAEWIMKCIYCARALLTCLCRLGRFCWRTIQVLRGPNMLDSMRWELVLQSTSAFYARVSLVSALKIVRGCRRPVADVPDLQGWNLCFIIRCKFERSWGWSLLWILPDLL